jgi:hypothetical protein
MTPTGGLALTGSPSQAGSIGTSGGIPEVTVNALANPQAPASYTFTSHPNGPMHPPDPGALNVEYDLPIAPHHTAQGSSQIRVWGIGLTMIGQSVNLNPTQGVSTTGIELHGGMGIGLAGAQGLASPTQSGLLVSGQITRAFGNWQGTDQTLELYFVPGAPPVAAPSGEPADLIAFSWPAGQTLDVVLRSMLANYFPDFKIDIAILPLIAPRGMPQAGLYDSLESFASSLNDVTQPLGADYGFPNYPGVYITVKGSTIFVDDFTQPGPVTQLAFHDLVGQPTWLGPFTIAFKTVMRADLDVGDRILFPPGIFAPYALTSPQAAVPGAPVRSRTAFQGAFVITELHHFANFRQADASSWVTAFTAIPTTP